MFEFMKGNAYSLIVTLYPSNITLNTSAAEHFKDVRWVMIGIDREHLRFGIKPVTKREIDLGLISKSQLHKISIGKGYARISNKSVINEISFMLNREFDGLKLSAVYDEKQNILVVDTKELVREGE